MIARNATAPSSGSTTAKAPSSTPWAMTSAYSALTTAWNVALSSVKCWTLAA